MNFFLRVYAMNLRRSWRSDIATAWSDALFTTEVLIVMPLTFLILVLWLVAQRTLPNAVDVSRIPYQAEIIFAALEWFALDTMLSRLLHIYRDKPISSSSFNSNRDRWILVVAGAIACTSCASLIWIIAILKSHH